MRRAAREAIYAPAAPHAPQLDHAPSTVPRPGRVARPSTDAVRFHKKSANQKLSPVELVDVGMARLRPIARAPFCCSTYVSIAATCNDSCAFKRRPDGSPGGCFADTGFTRISMSQMDEAAGQLTSAEVLAQEAAAIDRSFAGRGGPARVGPVPQDGARGGRDLRLHVGGDVGSAAGAALLAGAAQRWRARGGGAVWAYTHDWRTVPRAAWGSISVLASVERPQQIEEARKRGYPAAIVVREFPRGERAFRVVGTSAKVIPCPAETRDLTCVECRLCLDRDLLGLDVAIGFKVHGKASDAARRSLPVLR